MFGSTPFQLLDSRRLWAPDSGFFVSGTWISDCNCYWFQNQGFRIPEAKLYWIPESDFPRMRRSVQRQLAFLIPSFCLIYFHIIFCTHEIKKYINRSVLSLTYTATINLNQLLLTSFSRTWKPDLKNGAKNWLKDHHPRLLLFGVNAMLSTISLILHDLSLVDIWRSSMAYAPLVSIPVLLCLVKSSSLLLSRKVYPGLSEFWRELPVLWCWLRYCTANHLIPPKELLQKNCA